MLDIPALYRTVTSEEARRNHLLGILRFGSLKYFRTKEGAGRDEMEGIGSYTVDGKQHRDVSDERPIFPGFILCFSERPLLEYGNFVLELSAPHELRKRVMRSFPDKTSVEWQKVTYNKTEHLDSVPGPYEAWRRKYYTKPACFAHEMEWRLVIFLPSPLRLLNDTLKPCVGNLQGLFRYADHKETPMENANGMGLEEFVQEALFEVVNGVHKAAEKVRMEHAKGLRGALNTFLKSTSVDFDVAVTVSKDTGGSLKLSVPGIGVGANMSGNIQSENRVKFSVPVTFASQPVEAEHIMSDSPAPTPTGT